MMEFYLSKVWAFVIGAALMGVLVQGVEMQGQTAEEDGLQEVADNIRDLLTSMEEAGPGMEQVIEMRSILPPSATLTVNGNYAVLKAGRSNISFSTPSAVLFVQLMDGTNIEVSSLVLGPSDRIKIVINEGGLLFAAISQRTCPPGT